MDFFDEELREEEVVIQANTVCREAAEEGSSSEEKGRKRSSSVSRVSENGLQGVSLPVSAACEVATGSTSSEVVTEATKPFTPSLEAAFQRTPS